MVVQFLRNFGKVLGFDVSVDVPSLSVLQEGLLNIGDSMGEVQDLLVRLVSAAVCDPGLLTGYKVKKIINKICSKHSVFMNAFFIMHLWHPSAFRFSFLILLFGVTVLMLLKDCLCPVSLPRSCIFLGIFSTHPHFYLDLLEGSITSAATSFMPPPPPISSPFHSYPSVIFSVNLAVSFSKVCCLHQNCDVFMILFLRYHTFLSQHSSFLLQNVT